jgi:hypothetical protein
MTAAGQRRMTSVSLRTQKRRVVLTDPADRTLPAAERRQWYFSRVLTNLNQVRSDPIGAVARPLATGAASGGGAAAGGALVDDWLILDLDMPGGPGVDAGPPPPGVVVDFEPVPTLVHDRTWLRSLRSNPIHNGVLDALDAHFA